MFDQRALEVRIVGRDGWTYIGHFWRNTARSGPRRCAVYRPPRFIHLFETTQEVVMPKRNELHPALGCLLGILMVVLVLALIVGGGAFSAWLLMFVWNGLLVDLFGFPAMTFVHACCAMVLLGFARWVFSPPAPAK